MGRARILSIIFMFYGLSVFAKADRIELPVAAMKPLNGLMDSVRLLSTSLYVADEDKVFMATKQILDGISHLKIVLNREVKSYERLHLIKMLHPASGYLTAALSASGEARTLCFQKAMDIFVDLVTTYKLSTSNLIFYCALDNRNWIQEEKIHAQNPLPLTEASARCGVRVDRFR